MNGERTPQISTRKLDELLRNVLGIGDPRNPAEVAAALRARYLGESQRLEQESTGLALAPQSFGTVARSGGASVTAAPSTGAAEKALRWVKASAETDLDDLIREPSNREWHSELVAWRETLLREIDEGAAAARFAPDSGQRDRTALAIRRLGDYGWLARLVSVMNPELGADYRRLATTLYKGSDVLRVLLGQGLFEAGFADGGIIVRVSQADLMQRRDAVLRALRMFVGLEDDGENWGDGPEAYRTLEEAIDRASAPELKVFLREEMLAPVLDRLIGDAFRAARSTEFPASSPLTFDVLQLQRFADIAAGQLGGGDGAGRGVSPGLSAFARALQLFLGAFKDDRSGARYIDLAVPAPLAAWQVDEHDGPIRQVLSELVRARAAFALELEQFVAYSDRTPDELRLQVMLDRALFDADRAVDLLALGSAGGETSWGEQELRAIAHLGVGAALSKVLARSAPLDRTLPPVSPSSNGNGTSTQPAGNPGGGTPTRPPETRLQRLAAELAGLERIHGKLPIPASQKQAFEEVRVAVAREQLATLEAFERLSQSLAPRTGLPVGGIITELLKEAGLERPTSRTFLALPPPLRISAASNTAVLREGLQNLSTTIERAWQPSANGRSPGGPTGNGTPPSPGGPGTGGPPQPTSGELFGKLASDGQKLVDELRAAAAAANDLEEFKKAVGEPPAGRAKEDPLRTRIVDYNGRLRGILESRNLWKGPGDDLHRAVSDLLNQMKVASGGKWEEARKRLEKDATDAERSLNELRKL